MKKQINLGEFMNLIFNKPVFPGNTISHETMKQLEDLGLSKRDSEGNHIPTEKGVWVFNQLGCQTIEIKESHTFKIETK